MVTNLFHYKIDKSRYIITLREEYEGKIVKKKKKKKYSAFRKKSPSSVSHVRYKAFKMRKNVARIVGCKGHK